MIVMDTHILVWLDQGNSLLGESTRSELDNALKSESLAVSAITFWELSMLQRKGRIQLPSIRSWRNEMCDLGLMEIPVDGECSINSNELTDFHPDPTDRIIVATAIKKDATLITADERILNWKGKLRRLDGRC